MVPSFLRSAQDRGWLVDTVGGLLADRQLTGVLDGNHGNLYPRSEEFADSGVPYVSATNFLNNRVDYTKVKHLPVDRASKLKKGIAKDGDVLFAHNATVGPVALLETSLPRVILSTSVTFYRCDPEFIHNRFLLAYLESPYFQRQVERIMRQTTRSQVPITAQKQLWVALPPLPEQRKIADILSTWDRAIETSEALLATARTQKRALMQSLLTGKRRFSEFEGEEWKEVRLGDAVQLSKERLDPRKNHNARTCIELEHIEAETGRILGSIQSDQQASIKAVFGPGDILFGKLRPYLRKFAAPEFEGVCSTEIWVLKPSGKQITSTFLHCLVQSDGFMAEAEKSAGSKMPRADWKVVSEYRFYLPEPGEQERIAEVLIDCDSEIDRLNGQIDKLRTEKKALMQQLLTGKRRVAVDA